MTCELLIMSVVVVSRNERVNRMFPTEKVLQAISSYDQRTSVLFLPKKIPMIVKPKPYSPSRLGGYLLNDELYAIDLIRKK